MILSDKQIENLVKEQTMIDPYEPGQLREVDGIKRISFGQSSYGYDVRAASEVYIFSPMNGSIIDPKRFNKEAMFLAEIRYEDRYGHYVIIPSNSFALATTIEYIRMPKNVTGFMTTKSTYARCGIVSPPTVLEAGWEGNITIEISNTTPLPARIYVNEGIAQILFFEGEECNVSYADRKGKYQGQKGVTVAKV